MNHISQHPGISKADPNYRLSGKVEKCIDCKRETPIEYLDQHFSPVLKTYYTCKAECIEE